MNVRTIRFVFVWGALAAGFFAPLAVRLASSQPDRAALAAGGASQIPARPAVRFDGVYAVALEDEKDSSGPLCLVVRLYEDGTSVQAEFFGRIQDCSHWLSRGNERLRPGRWELTGDELTILESQGLVESERRGKISDEGWTTTPAVKVNDELGWALEPMSRAGRPPITFRFVPLAFPAGPKSGDRNRRPFFQGIGTSATHYDYDPAGNLKGIRAECRIQAGDLDGDSLVYAWTVSNGTAVGDGPHVVWTRELQSGKIKPGEISVEVTDGKGGRTRTSWISPGKIPGGWILYKP